MLKDNWLKEADQYMQYEYGLPIDQGCFTEDEFYSRFGDDGQRAPKEAVDNFAWKCDLFSMNECWCAPAMSS